MLQLPPGCQSAAANNCAKAQIVLSPAHTHLCCCHTALQSLLVADALAVGLGNQLTPSKGQVDQVLVSHLQLQTKDITGTEGTGATATSAMIVLATR